MSWRVSAPLVIVALAVGSPPAMAGSLSRSAGGVYTFAGTAEDETLVATRGTLTATFNLSAGGTIADGGLAGANCDGVGTARVTCTGSVTRFVLNGAAGNDSLRVAGAAPGTLDGGSGVDTLTGAADSDTLTGGPGNDVLTPGPGDDNTVTGGDDVDTVVYDDGRTAGVSVNLLTVGPQDDGGPDDGAAGSRENLVGIENVVGTPSNDNLRGSAADNELRGFAGVDDLDGEDGNDRLVPGVGDDGTVNGGPGVDIVSYLDGRTRRVTVDLAAGGQTDGGPDDNPDPSARENLVEIEDVSGTDAGDKLFGDALANELNGQGGNDELDGRANATGTDALNGGLGDDVLRGREGPDILSGGVGNDRLDGGDAADVLAGGDGIDTIDYAARTDAVTVTANVGPNNDGGAVDGAAAARDTVSGAEAVIAGAGDDTLIADGSGLFLGGGSGEDTLTGGIGADTLDGGGGSDLIDGAGGVDVVSYRGRVDAVSVTLNVGTGDDGGTADQSGTERDTTRNAESVTGGEAGDRLVGDGGRNVLTGGGGDDVLLGGAAGDVLGGGDGLDVASYEDRGIGQDVVVSLDGRDDDGVPGENDAILTDVEGLAGGAGADTLVGSESANVLTGGDGADRLIGLGAIDAFSGGPGDDTIEARDGSGEPVDCGPGIDSGTADAEDALVACENLIVLLERIDADRDGVARPDDCDDANATVRPGLPDRPDNGVDEDCSGADAINLDRDGDGVTRPRDCNDTRASIRPGVRDIPRNGIDEDCSGRDARYAVLNSAISFDLAWTKSSSRFSRLTLAPARKGSTLRVRCSGRCPFKSKSMRVRRSQRKLLVTGLVRGMTFRPGATLQFRITRPRTIGRVLEIKIRAGAPASSQLCIVPGARRPSQCPL
jgi:Ca2+-binding RTX toxin-like protein